MADSLFETIHTLEQAPTRCRVITEADELGFPARQLLYGKGRGTYRIIFDIRQEERHVRVLRIWHGSRDALTAADVEDSL
jgi:plasmid stabilization system protein ParE